MYKSHLYKTDFYGWTQEQVRLLTTQQWDQLDTINLIEEIETLGRKERQELRNRLGILLGHLLKWQFQNVKKLRLFRSEQGIWNDITIFFTFGRKQ
ncbi:DUF29 domain-containing protein [Plectonema radiosum NIES-515]|uniref:DUF29 domain-containing protein n=1 Tax=Plectonema radiosum NIES-515 TaxID=2986073 RepID=A0ABT3B4R6_9CYAN|nr:DUF29 domain-containing protein [Plectonema radiosum]MCV3216374.1 DUF29 domain-containing protein [Plectonema radiosum NIES-515]